MERFAFKIDAALKANLYKICRLCGIDNPGKVQILPQNEDDIIDLDEPSLSQKIYELVGFTVSGDDKMPQTMCSLCVDKINDFYEFREMCYATNKQIRNLLGLKAMEPEKLIDFKPIIKAEPQLMGPGGKRGRKRKTDDSWPRTNLSVRAPVKKEPVAFHKKLRLQPAQSAPIQPKTEPEIKEEPPEPETSHKVPPKKSRKSTCSVCGEKFLSKELADEHKSLVHVPSILRYVCNACNQTHHNQSDIRAHQLWHKLSKTPYKCPLCEASVANAYAFTRHLREHTPPTPVELLVLDRECPLCKKTFVTNFFYNTHRCAIRKRKCGGCSRALNTEAAYMRHAPSCAKIYLSHSKHIMPEVVTNEAQMRIKNEVEDDLLGLPPATAVPPDFVIDEGMQPVVVLERLSSPLLRASATVNRLGATRGKNSERVSAKKYLKRVDQLLKNTMNTLVSIKHEPEVHINDTGPAGEHVEPEPEREREEEPSSFGDDDFQACNDDSDDEQEPEPVPAEAASDNVPSVSVKQELLDEAYERQMEVKQEPLKLKLKITKNHGKLNSSLIDDLDEAGPAAGRSGKKKKKRKHREREKEASVEAEGQADAQRDQAMVNVKQEPVDNDYLPQATVMTTIPMTQLEGSYNESERHEEEELEEMVPVQEDVKPNRVELDRMMQISHVASGVDMAEEAMPLERAEEEALEATPDEPQAEKPQESPPKSKPTTVKSTARKSTGGVQRRTPRENPLPQIVSVESGEAVTFNMIPDINIKPEPRNRGYGDDEAEEHADVTEEINHNEKMDEENAYIDSLDLNNLTVKQEKDLDIAHETEAMHCNGLERAPESEGDDDGHEDSISSADEAEEAMEEEEEERIYREIELPPLEPPNEANKASQSVQGELGLPASEESSQVTPPETPEVEPPAPAFSLVITSICSQAAPELPAAPDQSQSTVDLEPTPENITTESQFSIEEVGSNLDGPPSSIFGASDPSAESQAVVCDNPYIECQSQAVPCSSLADEYQSLADLGASLPAKALECQSRTEFEPNPSVEAQTEADISSVQPLRSESLENEGSTGEELSAPIENIFQNPPATIDEVEPLPSSSSGTGLPPSENITQPPTTHSSLPYEQSMEPLDKPGSVLGAKTVHTDTLSPISLNGPKDNEALALPIHEAANYNCDEEQQNVLNQEISEQQQQAPLEDGQLLLYEAQPQAEEEECRPGPSTRPIEETENRINEEQQQQQQQPRCPPANNDDSNINEIAENNNNANIERELQDDALGGAQGEVNP